MSKKAFKSQASSGRAAFGGFGSSSAAFGATSSSGLGSTLSPLSYVSEPPDLSSFSDANLVVAFKNLSKRDSTTKAKALEDIQGHVSSAVGEIEEAVLEAWIEIFPRTSIDNSRRVRQLAFNLHGVIAVACGKRLAKYMPRAVGAWLCGAYDNDRGVSKAAQETLQRIFPTAEKLQNVRKAYQQPLIQYCRNVIDNESVNTLSDERTATPDDAQAKYSRVVAACASVIGSIVTALNADELAKQQEDYEELIGDNRLWRFASYNDAGVRRATHRLLRVCLLKQREMVASNLSILSPAFLQNALSSEQSGSAYEYIQTLLALSEAFPGVWTEHWSGKRTAAQRLRQFLKNGSHGGPSEFWASVSQLLLLLPDDVLPSSTQDAGSFAEAFRSGATANAEPRMNIGAAYEAYASFCARVVARLSKEDQESFLDANVMPFIGQYVCPAEGSDQWALPRPKAAGILSKMAIPEIDAMLEEEWPEISQSLINSMKTSLPEQSKDYDKSQTAVSDQGTRWATVQGVMLKANDSSSLMSSFEKSSLEVVKEAVLVLKNRNGKPYGAAGVLEALVRLCPGIIRQSAELSSLLERFVAEDLPGLYLTPARKNLTPVLLSFKDTEVFEKSVAATLRLILDAEDSALKVSALEALFSSTVSSAGVNSGMSSPELQNFLQKSADEAIDGKIDWDTFNRLLRSSSGIATSETTDHILSSLTQGLSVDDKAATSLTGLDKLAKQNPTLLKDFLLTPEGASLFQKLLFLGEQPNETVAQQALEVNKVLQRAMSTVGEGNASQSMISVVQQGLAEVSPTSVSVEALVEAALQLWKQAPTNGKAIMAEAMLPGSMSWEEQLSPFLSLVPRAPLAISDNLGGALSLVQGSPSNGEQSSKYDPEGYSAALRTGVFCSRLVGETDILEYVSDAMRSNLAKCMILTVQLANDNISLAGSNNFWSTYTPESEKYALVFISATQSILTKWFQSSATWWQSGEPSHYVLDSVKSELESGAKGFSSNAYYHARAFSILISELGEQHGWPHKRTEELEGAVKDLRRSKDTLFVAAFLAAYRTPLSSKGLTSRMCSELVADLTGLDISSNREKALSQLVLLNAIVQNQENTAATIAKQRLIFFIQHVIQWLQDDDVLDSVKAELCRVMNVLVPHMKDVYGSYWTDILSFVIMTWEETEAFSVKQLPFGDTLPLLHATLRLFSILRSLKADEEASEDLKDTWSENEGNAATALLRLLKQSRHYPDDFHQPLRITNELLARQISKIPVNRVTDANELLPLMFVASAPVQEAAFGILHQYIPSVQEQISFDAALEKKDARLPEELLSLILEAPTLDALLEASFERNIPLPLRGYLYSWLLVFDHFSNSSFKVKSDYGEHIKEGGYITGLLDFTFDFLGHARGKPIDASKFDITSYTPDMLESPEKDTQWLLTHIYYLCLKHLPSLTKSWWIDCRHRQKTISVETWTGKYITPLIVADALAAVSEWANTQDSEEQLTVKVNQRAKEVTAGYEVDEQMMIIAVRLPDVYPLQQASVEEINRVAVNEKKWNSWLINTRGVITFSNGSIIDGLIAFRKNVVGALKGQTECAICYSIISGDKQLPSKRCGTCKNLFHSSCLYKWFNTSNASTCPLCRNSFNYG